jgi:hypothetical protein
MSEPRSYSSIRLPGDGIRDFISAYAYRSQFGVTWSGTDHLDPKDRLVVRSWWKRILAAYGIAALVPILAQVSWTDRLGVVACGAIIAAFCMTSITALRLSAIASNVLFIAYGICGQFYPILLLHVVLLPINLVKLAGLHSSVGPCNGAATQTRRCDAVAPYHSL